MNVDNTPVNVNIQTARGFKHACSSCATRFYDLGKSPAACPRCGHKVPLIRVATRGRRRRGNPLEAMSSLPAPIVVAAAKPTSRLTK